MAVKRLTSENNKEYVTTSLEGYTERSDRNRGRSPRYVGARWLPERQYLALSEDTTRYCLTDSCPAIFNPGLCPGLRPLRFVQPYRLICNYLSPSQLKTRGQRLRTLSPRLLFPLSPLSLLSLKTKASRLKQEYTKNKPSPRQPKTKRL